MAYKKIGEYGIIGNGRTLALVGSDGAIDWLCLPYMDSPSVFAAILDDEKGGCFAIRPAGDWDSVQKYLPGTNILQTRFRTSSGEAELLDFMPEGDLAEKDSRTATMIVRRLRGEKGRVEFGMEFDPRFQYGLKKPRTENGADGSRIWTAGDESVCLAVAAGQEPADTWHVELAEGETLWFCMVYGEPEDMPHAEYLENLLAETEEFWTDWVRARETGKYPDPGFWREGLDRSALVLKLLQFRETGAIAAAATCSLPTIMYGERNWDYRFSWIRDTSMTLQALFELGHTREVSQYLEWTKKLGREEGEINLEVVYRLREPVPPGGEKVLEHLSGYKGSRPVHIGQYSVGQRQHDIYGELLDMVFTMSRLVGKIDPGYWTFVRLLVDRVVEIWRERDSGIWEVRTGPHHTTHSKLMCWVALDRGIKIAGHYGFPADLAGWRKERDAVRRDILEKGYNPERNSFTQHYETEAVDAALLQIPLVGFLPADDPRVASTIERIEKELMVGGLPLRYRVDDGLEGQEQGWLICLFWYLRCLIRQGRCEEVAARLRGVGHYANGLGLFGEEYDTIFQEITGNFPQAFSHIGYAMTVLEYMESQRPRKAVRPVPLRQKISLLLHGRNLTPTVPGEELSRIEEPGREIKRIMNILRGQFYDGHRQRVDYQRISDSVYYGEFGKAVAALCEFDPAGLDNDADRIAFWTNVFNTLVIHGVIELNISESVKEVPFFFERVLYTIGGYEFSLSDIEHGILRGNAVPPYRLRKRFREGDPRRRYGIDRPDPRIHFALVCASRTCPPVEAYTGELLDEQLDTSARVFINATTEVAEDERRMTVSMIFKWYREDFQHDGSELARYIAGYLYDPEEAAWVRDNAESLTLEYRPYDWRLNR
jgi:GH15 family glucan-1,4-alpha-glucosidase